MARTRRYKNLENNFVSRIMNAFVSGFKKAGSFFVRVFHIFDKKLTIMIVPHANGKVINIQTNVFALSAALVIIAGLVISFMPFARNSTGSSAELSRLKEENKEALASLDELRDENNNLLQSAKRFQNSLSQSLALLGIEQNEPVEKTTGGNGSDLASLFDTKDVISGSLKETSDIRHLSEYLENAVQPVEQITNMLKNQGTLFTDIPNIWPIKNGIGHISMAFGQNKHPFTGQWYIHKGMDISTYRTGDPVMATANGTVVAVSYDFDGYGNYIIIKHKHGIYTRYAHLSVVRVAKGDTVRQRQIIGNIGNTGMSTGPHLHYEVHVGSDVVDPAKYINIK
ncbi:MAG: peptidoglycan DD-metalloendopeptidase family protein [Treponema sp.]|nr:peptidoglycan DD-metalloendopeptidase family protein [Treponema sp.]MBR6143300.1 peptidoglycan DD-metalloendopeptidase family protein [Treponema sp.]